MKYSIRVCMRLSVLGFPAFHLKILPYIVWFGMSQLREELVICEAYFHCVACNLSQPVASHSSCLFSLSAWIVLSCEGEGISPLSCAMWESVRTCLAHALCVRSPGHATQRQDFALCFRTSVINVSDCVSLCRLVSVPPSKFWNSALRHTNWIHGGH